MLLCNEETKKITYLCKGYSNEYCYEHLSEHRHELNNELELIVNNYNQFQQVIHEEKQNSRNSYLIEKINQWEMESIGSIQRIAKECRTMEIKYIRIIRINGGQKDT